MKKPPFLLKAFVLSFILLVSQNVLAEEWWQNIEKEWKQSVVSIKLNAKNYLNGEDGVGRGNATGFVADSENGYIVTNAHVAGANPTTYNLVFFNNEEIGAKLVFIDPWHDFGILKYDPSQLSFKAKEVVFGNHKELHQGEQLVLIGNSESQGISTKLGNINKLFVNKGSNVLARHSHYIHLSLPRAGGASGSPLWNKNGHVVGLHAAGSENESFELRIDYVVDALNQIKKNRMPQRGDLYLSLGTISWSDAQKYFKYKKEYVDSAPKENTDLHSVLIVSSIMPNSKAYESLRIGDIIVGVKSETNEIKKIGYSLYDFDKFVDQNVDQNVTLHIFRRTGESFNFMDVTLPVKDANQSIARSYTSYLNAVFQDLTPSVVLSYGITEKEGVLMAQSDEKSVFWSAGREMNSDPENPTPGRKFVVIKEINFSPIKNLDDFNQKIQAVEVNDNFVVTFCDYVRRNHQPQCSMIKMENLEDEVLKTFFWNPSTLDWTYENSKE